MMETILVSMHTLDYLSTPSAKYSCLPEAPRECSGTADIYFCGKLTDMGHELRHVQVVVWNEAVLGYAEAGMELQDCRGAIVRIEPV